MEQIFVGDLFDALAAKLGYDDDRIARALGLLPDTVRAFRVRHVSEPQARAFCEKVGLDLVEIVPRSPDPSGGERHVDLRVDAQP